MKLKFLYLLLILIFLIPNVFAEFTTIDYMFPQIVIMPGLAKLENGLESNIILVKISRGWGKSEYFVNLCWAIKFIDDGECSYTKFKENGSYEFYSRNWFAEEIEIYYLNSSRAQEAVNYITQVYGQELAKVFAYIVYPLLQQIRGGNLKDKDFNIIIEPVKGKYKVIGGYLKLKRGFKGYSLDVSHIINLDIDKKVSIANTSNTYFDLKNGRIKPEKDGKIIIEWNKNGEKAKIELTNLEGDFYFVPKDNEVWWEKETIKSSTKRFLFWEIKRKNKELSEEVKDILGKIGFEKDSEIEIIYEKNKQKYVYEIKGNGGGGLFLTEIPYICPHKEIEIVSVFDNKITRIGEGRCYELDTSEVIAFNEKNIIPEFTKINNNSYYNLPMLGRAKPGIINGIEIRYDSLRLNRVTINKFGPFNILKK